MAESDKPGGASAPGTPDRPELRPGFTALHLGNADRGYLGFRIAFATLLATFYVTGVFDLGGGVPVMARLLFASGLVLFIIATVGAIVARLAFHQPSDRILWGVLPFDLVAAGMLIWATGHHQDPFYPWLLGISIAYAAFMHRRDAWIVSGLAAVVYLLAHFLGHGAIHAPSDLFLLVFKGAAIVFTGAMVASGMQRQAERQGRLLASQHEVRDLNERLSRRLAELRSISEITEVIHSTLDFDRVGPLVLDILSKVIDLPASALFVIDKDKNETLFSASSGVATTVARGMSDAYMFGLDDKPDETFACTTILDHKRLMVVFCASGDRIERMNTEDRLVLQAVSSELVVAVENSQLYKLTKRLSITDELTGLYNYRYLQQRLEDEIERARRYGRSLSLLMLDVDDFKKFNDGYGHIAGDRALAEIGGALRLAVREIDVACRYGGEEFAVLLPETDAEGAFVVAEKVREAIAFHSFADGERERGVHLTVSIGLATYPALAADREELLRQADGALYQAKTTGRDRVRAPSGEVVKIVREFEEAAASESADKGSDPQGGDGS